MVQTLLFYNYGYHTHEKAIMIPLILDMFASGRKVLIASIVNSIALLPLIPSSTGTMSFEIVEHPFLIAALFVYHLIFYVQQKSEKGIHFS
jgi:hypothetical protein